MSLIIYWRGHMIVVVQKCVTLVSVAIVTANLRGTSRRIQNMGFVKESAADGLWMTLNGGAMALSTQPPEGTTDPVFGDVAIKSGGYGIIDVAWKVHWRRQ